MSDGWQVEARPVPSALTDTFEAKPYDATLPFEHDHIESWNSFGQLLGPDGVKRLMRAVQ